MSEAVSDGVARSQITPWMLKNSNDNWKRFISRLPLNYHFEHLYLGKNIWPGSVFKYYENDNCSLRVKNSSRMAWNAMNASRRLSICGCKTGKNKLIWFQSKLNSKHLLRCHTVFKLLRPLFLLRGENKSRNDLSTVRHKNVFNDSTCWYNF